MRTSLCITAACVLLCVVGFGCSGGGSSGQSTQSGGPPSQSGNPPTQTGGSPSQQATPTITSISPPGGLAGTIVTINGTNLNGTTVNFNGTNATILSESGAGLVVTAPVGVASGPVTVTTGGGEATSKTSFNANVTNLGKSGGTTSSVTVGPTPEGMAINPDGAKVYVINVGNNTISVIGTATNTILTTIPIPQVNTPQSFAAISPDGDTLYVSLLNNIGVVDLIANTFMSTIVLPPGSSPKQLALSPSGATLYVANAAGQLDVIDTTNHSVTAVDLPRSINQVAVTPYSVAVHPSGSPVYVVSQGGKFVGGFLNGLSVIDATTLTVNTVGVGGHATDIVVRPDGAFVYVNDSGCFSCNALGPIIGKLIVFDQTASRQIAVVPWNIGATGNALMANETRGIAMSPDGKFIYGTAVLNCTLTNPEGTGSCSTLPNMTVGQKAAGIMTVDTATNIMTPNLVSPAGTATFAQIAIVPDGSRAYIGEEDQAKVFVLP